jgi:hypothetical protein
MRSKHILIGCLAVLVGLVGCESRTDKTDGGGVLLSVSDFDGLPLVVSMNAVDFDGAVQVDMITITSVVKDPFGASGPLMAVELDAYEVLYQRDDAGTRVPTKLVQQIFGNVPVNGTETIENLPVLLFDQTDSPPLSDLFFINGGIDQETQNDRIRLRVTLRFFGRTLSGDPVESAPVDFNIDFVP